MLCDDWLAFKELTARRANDAGHAAMAQAWRQLLETASRFVIAPDALALLNEINTHTSAESFHAARAHCVAPAYRTWIEWFCPKRQARAGFLLVGQAPDVPAVRGRVCIVVASKTINGDRVPVELPGVWDMPGEKPAIAISPEVDVGALKQFIPTLHQDFSEDLVKTLVTALALIASPRLTNATPADFSAVNKKRRRLGKAELLSHSELTLALDSEAEMEKRKGSSDSEGGRAFHHVRAHYRFKRGRIELVRHHTRGDKRFGQTHQRFTLRR